MSCPKTQRTQDTEVSSKKIHLFKIRCQAKRFIFTSCFTMRSLLVFTALSLFASGSSAAPFAPKKLAHVPQTVLDIRGGGGPIEPAVAAKVVGTAWGLNGIIGTLSPTANAKFYGLAELNEANAKTMRGLSISLTQIGILAYLLLFRKDCDINMAMGHAVIPWLLQSLSGLLNGDADTIGPSVAGDAAVALFTGAAVYGGITNADWAGNAFKAAGVFGLLSGIPCLLNAEFASELWGCKGGDENTNGLTTGLGATLTIASTLFASLAWGVEPVKAFGYAAAVAALTSIHRNFISEDFEGLGANKNMMLSWLAVYAVAAASILIEGGNGGSQAE